MTEEFIPYEQALALKELGFDEPCFGHYQQEWHDDGMTELEPSLQMIISKQHQHAYQIYTAPLYQQAFRWFREKGLHSTILPKMTPSNTTVYYIYEGKVKKNWDNCFETYEEAELACLNKLIDIVKNK